MFFQIPAPPTKEEEEDLFWTTPEKRFEPPTFEIRDEEVTDITTTTLGPLQPPVTTPSTTSPIPNDEEKSFSEADLRGQGRREKF